MDPQIKSILTTILGTICGSIATYAATKGVIPGEDKAGVADALVSAALYGITALIAWYKARQHTPAAQIAAVNAADNGVKVVAATAPAPTVTAPLKALIFVALFAAGFWLLTDRAFAAPGDSTCENNTQQSEAWT